MRSMFLLLRHLGKVWQILVKNCNERGIPLPLIRDPKTKRGDVALTLVVISSIYVQISLIGKWAGKLGGIPTSEALTWFYSCAGLYFARKMTWAAKGEESLDPPKPPTSI